MEIPAADKRDGFADFNRLNSRLSGLDERGLVLSLSAFAEDSLGELLRVFMRDHPAVAALLDGFNAPLGTFSARIKAAVALGLITPDQFADLENLRKIRNKFSHTWDDVSFEDQDIKGRIEKFSFSNFDDNFPSTSFEKIKSSITSVLIEIRVTINEINKRGLTTKLIGSRLFSGLSGDSDKAKIASAREKFDLIRERFRSAEPKEQEFLLMIKQRLCYRISFASSGASSEGRIEYAKLIAAIQSEDWLERN